MSSHNKCAYQEEYRDIDTNRTTEYKCGRTTVGLEEYCELHSPGLWRSDPDRVNAALEEEMVKSSNIAGCALIGFHLPDIDLSSRHFGSQVYFERTVFHGRADFEGSTFEKSVSFRKCVFERLASFGQANFVNKADFMGMKAAESLSCRGSRFSSWTQLSACVIQRGDFRNAEFDEVLIRDSQFTGQTDFGYAKFNGHCQLVGSSFPDRVSFEEARFTTASISGVGFHGVANFGQVTFEHPENTRFDSDLSNVSFLGTDLFRVRFGSSTAWDDSRDFVPYDVREFEKNPSKMRLADALSVLRDLRENYEYRLDYEGAGKLFVQEMEIRRQYEDAGDGSKLRPWCRRWLSLISGYRLLCRYGESLRFPAAWMALVFVASVGYFYTDEVFAEVGTCQWEGSDKARYALTRTLSGLLQWGCHALPDYALRAASIPILGTVFVVLRRRFERRFRH